MHCILRAGSHTTLNKMHASCNLTLNSAASGSGQPFSSMLRRRVRVDKPLRHTVYPASVSRVTLSTRENCPQKLWLFKSGSPSFTGGTTTFFRVGGEVCWRHACT